MARLYLIRHAQSANNAVWNGDVFGDGRVPDPEITSIGHRQATCLGEHLAHPTNEPRQHPFKAAKTAGFNLSHLYCSLMTRSILTAEYISDACSLELHALADIYEKHGIFESDIDGSPRGVAGPDRGYFESRFPRLNLPGDFNNDGWWNRPFEVEDDFFKRMESVVAAFKLRHGDSDDRVAMVVHGDFLDQFLNELMGVARHPHNYQSDWVANWSFHNTSISRIDFDRGAYTVIYTNRIDHLAADLVTW
jgi:2,3-bisphosphoglycerate-dependent phosphoglycerate mutase